MMRALFPESARIPAPYLAPQQAQRRPPTDYENRLGNALEAAFGAGAADPASVAAHFNARGFRTAGGEPWTAEALRAALAELAK